MKEIQIEKHSTHVRLNQEEYDRLTADQELHGQSIPKLLKRAYFSGPLAAPLLSKDQYRVLMGELGRIGNNLNQIARHLNAGFREGFNQDLSEIKKMFSRILAFVGAN